MLRQGYHTEHKPEDKTVRDVLSDVKHFQAFGDLVGGEFVCGNRISI